MTCLLDTDQTLYDAYYRLPDGYAPFPVQLVIDRDGIITYASAQYDADAVKTAIAAALAD